MTKSELLNIVQSQLATDLNCTLDDLNGEKDSFVFTTVKDNPGRRPFPRSEQHFEMLSMGMSIVVSASPSILDIAKSELSGKSRDEAFSMPFVYGHSLYYPKSQIIYTQIICAVRSPVSRGTACPVM